MRQVQRSRSATKARANSVASTGDSLAGPQFAISRPCETAKSWRSLPLNAEIVGLPRVQLVLDCRKQALALIESLSTIYRISKIGPEKRASGDRRDCSL